MAQMVAPSPSSSTEAVDPNGGAVLDAQTLLELQAGAFQSLVHHLQDRSDAVSNMDLMTISGFCRNCLAKVRVYVCVCLKL